MNFSTFGFPAVVLILLTASMLLISRQWRLSIAALVVQYLGVFFLVAMPGYLVVALAKLVTGWMAGMVLILALIGTSGTGSVLAAEPESESSDIPTATPSGWLFRLLSVGIVGLAVSSITAPLLDWAPGLQFEQAWGALLLIGLGLLHLGLTTQPLNVVLGLLTVLSGFEILYSAVEISALVTGLLAGVNLGLALVGAYLLLSPNPRGGSVNTPFIWIILPGFSAIVLYFIRKRERATRVSGILISAILALLGWQIPIGEQISLGPISLEIGDTLAVLGRHFTLGPSDRPVLVLIYLAVAFWFIGSAVARTDQLFVPVGLGIAALLTGALAVEPFLYAALLIEMVVLVSMPLFVPPGKTASRGPLRYLVYQTLGMPFLLLSGWALARLETSPGDPIWVVRATLLMGLGFMFILGIFPFHTWIPMIAEEANPYIAAFILFELPLAVSLFGLDFLERYAWLRSTTGLYVLLRLAGGLMVFFGGLWAAFQSHLGRMMGYAVVVEIGLSLLALGAGAPTGDMNPLLNNFFSLLLPYGLALAVWALALVTIRTVAPDLRFRSVMGIARNLPLASSALFLAHFSMAGFPLLAGFPVQLSLWENLAGRYPFIAIEALFGIAGLMVGGLRTLAVLVMGPAGQEGQASETWDQVSLLGLGMIALLLVGLMPQWFLPFMTNLASGFLQTGP